MHVLINVAVEAKVDSGGAIGAAWNDAIHDLEIEHLSFRLNNHLSSSWTLPIANRAVLTFLLNLLLILLVKYTFHWESPFEVLHR